MFDSKLNVTINFWSGTWNLKSKLKQITTWPMLLWLCDSFLPSKMSPQMSSNDDLQHWSRLSVIRALAYPFPGFASCYRYVEYRMFLRFFEYCRIHFRADHQQMSSQHAYRDKLWQASVRIPWRFGSAKIMAFAGLPMGQNQHLGAVIHHAQLPVENSSIWCKTGGGGP